MENKVTYLKTVGVIKESPTKPNSKPKHDGVLKEFQKSHATFRDGIRVSATKANKHKHAVGENCLLPMGQLNNLGQKGVGGFEPAAFDNFRGRST